MRTILSKRAACPRPFCRSLGLSDHSGHSRPFLLKPGKCPASLPSRRFAFARFITAALGARSGSNRVQHHLHRLSRRSPSALRYACFVIQLFAAPSCFLRSILKKGDEALRECTIVRASPGGKHRGESIRSGSLPAGAKEWVRCFNQLIGLCGKNLRETFRPAGAGSGELPLFG